MIKEKQSFPIADEAFDEKGNIRYRIFKDEKGIEIREDYFYYNGVLNTKRVSYLDLDGNRITEDYDAQGELKAKEVSYSDGKSVVERYDSLLHAREESYKDEHGKAHYSFYDENGRLISKTISFFDKQGIYRDEVYKNNKIESRCIRYPNAMMILELYDDEEKLIDLSFRDENQNTIILWKK